MKTNKWMRRVAFCLAVVLLLGTVAAALSYDLNGDGKTNIWDLQYAINQGKSSDEQVAVLHEAMGGKGDELHKNADGKWEIWSEYGLYNMAKLAQSGDTFVLMQDIDLRGMNWTPIVNFNGTLEAGCHKVSNLTISQSVDGNVGFFASIAEGGTVIRLNLADMNVLVPNDATSIGLVAGTCAGKIDACTAIGFITDEREILPADLKVGGLVGTLTDSGEVATHVENMLYRNGVGSDDIPNISAKLAVRTTTSNLETYRNLMKIVGAPGNGVVDSMALLEDMTGILPNPNAIAWVENGDVTEFPIDLAELLAAIDADGNSVVTLQKDLSNNGTINVPYSSTWDLNGYTIRTNPKSGFGLHILAAGSEKKVTTVKNGSLYHYGIGVRVMDGGIVISNMKMYGTEAPCVGIYGGSSDYNAINVIEDSELYHSKWGVFAYNEANTDYSNVNITVQRSKLVAYKAGGSALFVKRSSNDGTIGGMITLGFGAEMYTYGSSVVSGNTLTGVDPVKMEELADVDVDGVLVKGLNHWTTNESVIATEVIAEVTNGTETTQVTNTADMVKLVKANGKTQIKLVKDIVCNSQLTLPYSCTIDLNNFTITNNSSTALRFAAVGTENTVAYVKNGTVNHYVHGVYMDTGSVNISNVTFNSLNTSSSICFIDPNGAYRANNKIDNCYIYNPKGYCINWNVKATDFSNTGVTITNSTLISPSGYVFARATDAESGVITLGEHVEMYGKNTYIGQSSYRYAGLLAGREDNVTLTVKDGTKYTGLYHWSTDKQTQTTKILMLGNSLSNTVPQELYEIARQDGIDLMVTNLYHAGAYGWQHKNWIINDSDEYEFRIYNDMGYWFHGDIKSVPDAVAYMDWEYVSYQEFITATYGKTYEQAVAKYEPYVNWIFDYFKAELPDAKLYFYQHWSWQVGHSTVQTTQVQKELFTAIKAASRYFAEQNGVTLVPVGEAWELARADALIGDTLAKDDCLHPEATTGGQYIGGCVFYEVMFKNSCLGNPWRASNGPSEEKHLALQQHAHDAVAAFYGEDYAK